jgi:hypothetical protein
MGGIAEEHFVGVHPHPLRAQATGDVATDTIGEELDRDQPGGSQNAEGRRGDTRVGPGRHGAKAGGLGRICFWGRTRLSRTLAP